MNKFNFLSEGNIKSNIELDNEKYNYYSKNLNNDKKKMMI